MIKIKSIINTIKGMGIILAVIICICAIAIWAISCLGTLIIILGIAFAGISNFAGVPLYIMIGCPIITLIGCGAIVGNGDYV